MKPRKQEPRRAVPDLSDDPEDLDRHELTDGQPLEDARVLDCDFSGRTLSINARRSVFESVSFAGATLTSIKLRDVRLIRCDLSNATLHRWEANRVELIDCRLTGVKAAECRLEDILFERCEASYALLDNGTARRAEFIDSRFREAVLTGLALDDSLWTCTDLARADLRNAKLRGADLRGSTLEGIAVNAADVAGAIVSADQAMDLARLLGLVIR